MALCRYELIDVRIQYTDNHFNGAYLRVLDKVTAHTQTDRFFLVDKLFHWGAANLGIRDYYKMTESVARQMMHHTIRVGEGAGLQGSGAEGDW